MEKSEMKEYIAKRVAKELQDGDLVNLGIGIPTLVPKHLPADVHVTVQTENGIVGADLTDDFTYRPLHVVDAGGAPTSIAQGGAFVNSADSFAMIRGGHVDVTILGGLEVDEEGSLANWIIPGKKMPGMGGAMDLLVGAKRVIVAMEHTAKGKHKILTKCRLPYTAIRCVNLIITEMAVFEVTKKGLVLTEYNPEYTVEQIQEATEAQFKVSRMLTPIQV